MTCVYYTSTRFSRNSGNCRKSRSIRHGCTGHRENLHTFLGVSLTRKEFVDGYVKFFSSYFKFSGESCIKLQIICLVIDASLYHQESSDKNPKIALTWALEGKHRRGQPRGTWRRTVNKEREHLGFKTWRQAEVAARHKVAWRRRINHPILLIQKEGINDDDTPDLEPLKYMNMYVQMYRCV